MTRTTRLVIFLLGIGLARPGHTQPLPAGSSGIAAKYPGDVGIGADPAVIFADDFESYGSGAGLTAKWDSAYHAANIRIATEAANVHGGSKALELTVPKQSSEVSNTALKTVSPGRDVLFLRYYSRYDTGFDVLGSSHNGSTMSSNYCCPGVPADGYNKFLVSYEAGRETKAVANPGQLNLYIYHPDQRDIWGDHFYPTGVVYPFSYKPFDFGPDFVSRPDVTPQLGKWYCYELMVKTNTPGKRDGRVALWLDGKLIADFLNLRLRDVSKLKIDRFSLDFHIKSNTAGATKKWYDNVVAATSYIGPVAK